MSRSDGRVPLTRARVLEVASTLPLELSSTLRRPELLRASGASRGAAWRGAGGRAAARHGRAEPAARRGAARRGVELSACSARAR
jgi:hypothetical protein